MDRLVEGSDVVEILTLFMWLTTGGQLVELGVAGEVATVEVRLDGRTIRVLQKEPWSFKYDFGTELAPRELAAIARDRQGRELDRTTRWINLRIGTADAKIELETDERRRPRAARVSWESIGARAPAAVEMTFDGAPLEVVDPGHVPLPPYDEKALHIVTASVLFPNGQEVLLNASFGGLFGDEVTSQLTAVPVVLEKGGRLPRPEAMSAWFVKNGEPLEVYTVEKGGADVVIVRDPAAQTYFEAITKRFGDAKALGRPMGQQRAGQRIARTFHETLTFPNRTFTTFLSPFAVPLRREEVTAETFYSSPSLPAGEHGLLWLADRHPPGRFPMQLADAVALAGMDAHAAGRRRAVILILGEDPEDLSRHSPPDVRRYLSRLRVPLYVWSMTSEASHPQWGDLRFVGYPPGKPGAIFRLRDAVREVGRDLGKQRTVWLRGRHLPQDIRLGDAAVGVRLAGDLP